MLKHLQTQNDDYFDGCGLPVDVFHFKSKHKVTNKFCQLHCNLAKQPELYNDGKQKWVFNCLIVEQTNVWINGSHSMLHEMTASHYDFFLDKMIMRQNRQIISKLEEHGKNPHLGGLL